MSIDPYTIMGGGGGGLTFEWKPRKNEPFIVAHDLDTAAGFLEDMHKVLATAREVVIFDVKAHFEASEGPNGPWPPLATTSNAKASHAKKVDAFFTQSALPNDPNYVEHPGDAPVGGGPSTLTKSGAGKAVATARTSLKIESDPKGGSIRFSAVPPDYMLEHNRGAMGRYTEGGFFEGPNPLPKRQWLWLSEGAADAVYQIFEDFVDDATALVVNPMTGGTAIRTTGGFFASPTMYVG